MMISSERSSVVSTIVAVAVALAPSAPGVLFLGRADIARLVSEKIAHTRGSKLHVIRLDANSRVGDLAATLTNLEPDNLVLVENIQDIPSDLFDILHQAIYDFSVPIKIGDEGHERSISLEIQPFTLFVSSREYDARAEQLENAVAFICNLSSLTSMDDARSVVDSKTVMDLLGTHEHESNPAEGQHDLRSEIADVTRRISEITEAINGSDYSTLITSVFVDLMNRLKFLREQCPNSKYDFELENSIERMRENIGNLRGDS
jgi:Holliday junction resolvasome RuvABC ATP-dependent DNA helicase subunit